MSDPRFARLRSDPRFRRPQKHQSKLVVDNRFKEAFEKGGKTGRRVDKYGRPIANTQEQDNLRRFYRLESEQEEGSADAAPDYARGGLLLESSDEDGEEDVRDDIITAGRDRSEPIAIHDEAEVEIDLDEKTFADLDAQAAAYGKKASPQEMEGGQDEASHTFRLAVVNLDWDHVRASHLYKIFSSLISPTPSAYARQSVNGGKVLNVRVYPSEFGKERLAREEKEGPPADVFKKRHNQEEEVNERNIYDVGDEDHQYDEDALRQYQLERLRYYYAIVTCDSVDTASHIYSELEGTELERSANVFDLSFVPDEMSFDDDYESTEDSNTGHKGIDFVTTALRHSKVQLTWDEDDAERNQVTRRTLTRQEIEEAEFKAYVASSASDSGTDTDQGNLNLTKKLKSGNQRKAKAASRDKLRALLLGSGDDDLPEGWGRDDGERKGDVDMEITFMPGLSKVKGSEEETSLEKYQRKLTEKRKKRKEETKEKGESRTKTTDAEAEVSAEPSFRPLSTPDELALLIASDNPATEPKHFNLKSVLKAEKKSKGRRKGKKTDNEDDELQEHFSIDLRDDRFKALHEDHTFAIDPSNPRFKKTTSMVALLEERSKRLKDKRDGWESANSKTKNGKGAEQSLKSLVESVKRKSAVMDQPGVGKRRKL